MGWYVTLKESWKEFFIFFLSSSFVFFVKAVLLLESEGDYRSRTLERLSVGEAFVNL